jgi:N-acetylmuramate 1-kinase
MPALMRRARAVDCLCSGKRLVLRDYHAENLLWLPDAAGLARVGLLDFQDAAMGQPAYDLVSLLRGCAPRRVRGHPHRRHARRFAGHRAGPRPRAAACAVLGAQRNLRILGIFARLSLPCGKAAMWT